MNKTTSNKNHARNNDAFEQRNNKCRLFVGGFQASLSNFDIFQYFSQFGEILNAQIMFDKKTKKSRSFGFIECGSNMVAEKILSIKHAINGRDIDVNQAFKKNNKDTTTNWKKLLFRKKLFVTNLPEFVQSIDLEEHFSKFGPLRKAYIITDPLTKRPKGFGYAEFFDLETLNKVLMYKNHSIAGHKIMCFRYKHKDQQEMEKEAEEQAGKLADVLKEDEVRSNTDTKNESSVSLEEKEESLPSIDDFEEEKSLDEEESKKKKEGETAYVFENEEEREIFSLQKEAVEFWQKRQMRNQIRNTQNQPWNQGSYPPQNNFGYNQDNFHAPAYPHDRNFMNQGDYNTPYFNNANYQGNHYNRNNNNFNPPQFTQNYFPRGNNAPGTQFPNSHEFNNQNLHNWNVFHGYGYASQNGQNLHKNVIPQNGGPLHQNNGENQFIFQGKKQELEDFCLKYLEMDAQENKIEYEKSFY